MYIIKVSLLAAAAFLFGAACTQSGAPGNTNANVATIPSRSPDTTPAPPSAPVSELTVGKEIYATNCITCHKADGTGGNVTIDGKTLDPDDLTTAKMKNLSDQKLIGYVTNGIPDEGMPAFKDKLTEQEIKDVVQHVRTLQNAGSAQ
ncbi:MAG: cytochrome c [Pyrinomonadaceae bacterium]